MPPNDITSLPFLTRKMLNFEQGATFGLRVISQASEAGNIIIRGITKEGAFTLKHTITSDSAVNTENFRLPDIPTLMSVFSPASIVVQGAIYVSVYLTLNGDVIYPLCSGFIYDTKAISWPTSNTVDEFPNAGQYILAYSSNPAAGSEISLTVPQGLVWRIIAARVQLVSDATVSNRRIHLVFSFDAVALLDCFGAIEQAASETRNYSFGAYSNIPDGIDGNDIPISIPNNIVLREDGIISTETTNLQAGDNFGIMTVLVEQFMMPT